MTAFNKNNIPEGGMTIEAVAAELNLTVRQVKALENSALKKLSAPSAANKKFRDYIAHAQHTLNHKETKWD